MSQNPASSGTADPDSRRKIYVVLLHSPMVDRAGKEVTTAVTNLDIHDIARSCKTYGVDRYFIVNPEPEQKRLVGAILGHWHAEVSKVYHPARAKALSLVQYADTFEEAFNEVFADSGVRPYVAMPDARRLDVELGKPDFVWSYRRLRQALCDREIDFQTGSGGTLNQTLRPLMLVFGTGWGIAPSFFPNVDRVLAPVQSAEAQFQGYRHLSVRAAAAIVLDRLFGDGA